jgi:uncharacterized RDD family membrane protein YckC
LKLSLKRLLAYWIDFIIVAFILIGIQWALYKWTEGFPFDYLSEGYEIELWVLSSMSLPVWLYFIYSELKFQQTFGKRLFKLIVVNKNESKISINQAIARTFVRLLPWELTHLIILIPTPWWSIEEPNNEILIYIPNLIMALYIIVLFANKGRKGIHDVITNTRTREWL